MLALIIDVFKFGFARRRRTLPSVRIELHDLELEQRKERAALNLLNPDSDGLVGLEFRFEAFSTSGQRVCTGKIDHIPGRHITVRKIDTEEGHRRNGFGTSAVIELSKHFGGIPIVPMNERGDGVHFWSMLRKRSDTAVLIKEQISLTEASHLLRQAESIASSRR